jgi:hypothetical protein
MELPVQDLVTITNLNSHTYLKNLTDQARLFLEEILSFERETKCKINHLKFYLVLNFERQLHESETFEIEI